MQSKISLLVEDAERGDRAAADALFTALYAELRRMSKRELARQGGGVSLGASTLLHQAYLEIASDQGVSFPDRGRFMAYASRVMRGLIIDYARSRSAQKRGGEFHITSTESALEQPADEGELTCIGDALDELAAVEPALVEVVDLKFFCGFTFAEIAAMKGLSERTVQRHWEKARMYLHRKLSTDLKI